MDHQDNQDNQDDLPLGFAFIQRLIGEEGCDSRDTVDMKRVPDIVKTLNGKIEAKEKAIKEIKELLDSINNKKPDGEQQTEHSAEPQRKKVKANDEAHAELSQEQIIQLRDDKDVLTDQLLQLNAQDKRLPQLFQSGGYYACTSDYLAVEEDTGSNDTPWSEFVRVIGNDDSFTCRSTTGKGIPKDLYKLTSTEAANSSAEAADSQTNRSSAPNRPAVWPTDIFGVSDHGEVAYLIPAGSTVHKQWMNVAAAVLGLQTKADIKTKMKAVRGVMGDSTSEQGIENDAESLKPKTSRKRGTGVIHFVSNKLRMAGQTDNFDGDKPTVLIIPVMRLDEAKGWRGQGYDAICLAGCPRNSSFAAVDADEVYFKIQLYGRHSMENTETEHATVGQLKTACEFLKQAVMALRDMIASLGEREIAFADDHDASNIPKLRDAFNQAQQEVQMQREEQAQQEVQAQGEGQEQARRRRVPKLIRNFSDPKQRPVRLITFGAHNSDKHPAPDPLLLVLRAANSFGKMAGMKMLASGSPDDDDISEGDIIAEEAFLRAREQARRENLARRVGQPNGYYLAATKNDDDDDDDISECSLPSTSSL